MAAILLKQSTRKEERTLNFAGYFKNTAIIGIKA